DIITGLEEGRLIHLGVIANMRTPPPRLLLIDLGGGSCELTVSEKGHIKELVTLPVGAVRLTQEFIHHDPPNKDDLKRLLCFIVLEVAHVSRQIIRGDVRSVIATSGTAAVLAGAAKSLKLSRGESVSEPVAAKLGKRLAKLTARQRGAIKGINP